MFADQDNVYLGGKLSRWWRKKKKQRRLVVGLAIGAAVTYGAYKYYKGSKIAGDAIAKKSGAPIPQTKAQSKGLWTKVEDWYRKKGLEKKLAGAAVRELAAGKRDMPPELKMELQRPEPAKTGVGTAALVGGAALVGAAVIAKGG